MVSLFGLGLVIVSAIVSMAMMRSFRSARVANETTEELRAGYRREFHSYLYCLAPAFALTALPFGLVYWSVLPHYWIVSVLGVFAVIQIIVHFRFFMHINPRRQKADDLHLILFSTLILTLMGGGTIWVLANLAMRMH